MDGADRKFGAQSAKGIQAIAVATHAQWFEAILDAKPEKEMVAPRLQWV